MKQCIVFVLDVSISMIGTKCQTLQLEIQRFIEKLQLGNHVGIVLFNKRSWIEHPVVQITDGNVRNGLQNKIPQMAADKTDIRAGVMEGLNALKLANVPTEGAVLFLVTGSKHNCGSSDYVGDVIVNCLAIGNKADPYLELLTKGTAGRMYAMGDVGENIREIMDNNSRDVSAKLGNNSCENHYKSQFIELLDKPIGSGGFGEIIHRDLKPENILIAENVRNGRFVKLCDFGLAVEHRTASETQSHSVNVGTFGYRAPELTYSKYTVKTDIFSLGILSMELFNISLDTCTKKFRICNTIDANKYKIKLFHVFNDVINETNILFVTYDDKAYGLGCNYIGCLGLGHEIEVKTPQLIPKLCGQRIKQFINGWDFVLGVNEDNYVFSWGHNSEGQLGRHVTEFGIHLKPENIPDLNDKNITQICCGYKHSLALTTGGQVYGWGSNYDGQIGTDAIWSPKLIPQLNDIKSISSTHTGDNHFTCFLSNNNSIKYKKMVIQIRQFRH
ncbi:unnamed protein product [Oppiella nova]|uniref:Protein kinase domain-containing protein n=1 Tax=Oppiella nova TaxID=334625 RepID=A0A7R9QB99_9ACAR|nr:unnamed protein product [Oppiella nova]CAG2161401.1 unnamed protein product [Oppiella nova]